MGIILGSGLGGLAEAVSHRRVLPFERIPSLETLRAPGHPGEFVSGEISGVLTIVQRGGLHLYEGHAPSRVALPVESSPALGRGS